MKEIVTAQSWDRHTPPEGQSLRPLLLYALRNIHPSYLGVCSDRYPKEAGTTERETMMTSVVCLAHEQADPSIPLTEELQQLLSFAAKAVEHTATAAVRLDESGPPQAREMLGGGSRAEAELARQLSGSAGMAKPLSTEARPEPSAATRASSTWDGEETQSVAAPLGAYTSDGCQGSSIIA
jgi:hypothetical protein